MKCFYRYDDRYSIKLHLSNARLTKLRHLLTLTRLRATKQSARAPTQSVAFNIGARLSDQRVSRTYSVNSVERA